MELLSSNITDSIDEERLVLFPTTFYLVCVGEKKKKNPKSPYFLFPQTWAMFFPKSPLLRLQIYCDGECFSSGAMWPTSLALLRHTCGSTGAWSWPLTHTAATPMSPLATLSPSGGRSSPPTSAKLPKQGRRRWEESVLIASKDAIYQSKKKEARATYEKILVALKIKMASRTQKLISRWQKAKAHGVFIFPFFFCSIWLDIKVFSLFFFNFEFGLYSWWISPWNFWNLFEHFFFGEDFWYLVLYLRISSIL